MTRHWLNRRIAQRERAKRHEANEAPDPVKCPMCGGDKAPSSDYCHRCSILVETDRG